MEENNFYVISEAILQIIYDQIEDNLADYLHSELQNGVLTITLETEAEYVINRHLPSQQIWMSSPLSGGTYFNHDDQTGKWVSTKDSSVTFRGLLASELRQITGVPFYFDQ